MFILEKWKIALEHGLSEKVVLFLSESFQHKGLFIWTTSFLLQGFLQKMTYVCGTMWASRKDYPSTLNNATLTTRGDFQLLYSGPCECYGMDGRIECQLCEHLINYIRR